MTPANLSRRRGSAGRVLSNQAPSSFRMSTNPRVREHDNAQRDSGNEDHNHDRRAFGRTLNLRGNAQR
jgi:hypothetical protein